MKKIFISIRNKSFFLLFTFLPFLFFSQSGSIRYGIKVGWNYSVVDAIDNNGEISGYISGIISEVYGGLVVEKQITQKSYIQTGFLFSFTESVNFIELPIFYKYNFYKDFSVLLGPKIEYIPDEQFNNNYYFRKRFGLSANLGIDYKISNKWIAEAYYSKAFVKQYDDLDLGYFQSKRNVYRVGISYFFN